MPQFDVHRNLGQTRRAYPFLVVVQSSMLRHWDRRVVVPLATADPSIAAIDRTLNPSIAVAGQTLTLAAHQISNVPLSSLGEIVGNLSNESAVIIGAVDWLLNQGFG